MKLTHQQVLHVAKLARLAVTDDEVAQYVQQLSSILDAVDVLATVDTGAVGDTVDSHGTETLHLRPDEVDGEVGTARALSNAPAVQDSSFAIPKVLE
jgi:aspartyl-tRNA(Asn)/glutamyl-tRNA(Gln) amidotransferase subunit C